MFRQWLYEFAFVYVMPFPFRFPLLKPGRVVITAGKGIKFTGKQEGTCRKSIRMLILFRQIHVTFRQIYHPFLLMLNWQM